MRFDLAVSKQRSREVADTLTRAVEAAISALGSIFVYEIADVIRISNGDTATPLCARNTGVQMRCRVAILFFPHAGSTSFK